MVVCEVCPHACSLTEGKVGICGVRTVQGGDIVSLNYGEATSLALDRIEKKPFARFHPGKMILSYGSYGCNLRCEFCQNSDISMASAASHPRTHFISPDQLVDQALALRDEGNIGIAFTYNEPLIAPEYLVDTAKRARERGLLNAVVTNGYATEHTMNRVIECVDAFNIDLKCFTEEGYRTLGAPNGLATVKRSITSAVKAGAHVEVTTLIVPGLSDDADLFEQECKWIAALDPSIPLHLSRFFPAYRSKIEAPTPHEALERLLAIANRYLDHVYLGNM